MKGEVPHSDSYREATDALFQNMHNILNREDSPDLNPKSTSLIMAFNKPSQASKECF